MKLFGLVVVLAVLVLTLSCVPTQAGVYKLRSKSSCSGVSRSREFSKGKSCSGVSRSSVRSVTRAKRSCAG